MASGTLKGCHIVTSGKWDDQYTPEKMKQWISGRDGSYHTKIIPNSTTHLVVTTKHWYGKAPLVREALKANALGENIKIVTFDWLDDSLRKGKRKERNYLWDGLERKSKRRSKTKVADDDDCSDANLTLGSVLEDHSKEHIDEKLVKKAQKKIHAEEEILRKEQQEKDMRDQELIESVKNQTVAAVFKKGASKARNEILSTNHHIYHDQTGFAYEIVVTKIDCGRNRNERWAITVSSPYLQTLSEIVPSLPTRKAGSTDHSPRKIQIYESNTTPHTYAVNAQFAATGTPPKSEVIGPIGSTYETAFRIFRELFQEKTKVTWEERVIFAAEAERRAYPSRYLHLDPITGSSKWSTTLSTSRDFQTAPFEYTPPSSGPLGVFPFDQTPVLEKLVGSERWSSDHVQQSPTMHKLGDYGGEQVSNSEFRADYEEESESDSPYMMSGGNGNDAHDSPLEGSSMDKLGTSFASLDNLVADRKLSVDDPFGYPFPQTFAQASSFTEAATASEHTSSAGNDSHDASLKGTSEIGLQKPIPPFDAIVLSSVPELVTTQQEVGNMIAEQLAYAAAAADLDTAQAQAESPNTKKERLLNLDNSVFQKCEAPVVAPVTVEILVQGQVIGVGSPNIHMRSTDEGEDGRFFKDEFDALAADREHDLCSEFDFRRDV